MHERSILFRCALAAISTVAALVLDYLIPPLGPSPPLLLFAAITFSAWAGGLGPGLLATVVGAFGVEIFLIDPRYHERIFGVFERVHRDDRYPGAGVGLAFVRKAMARVGGTVGVESAAGQGSRFWIELPIAYPEGASEEPPDPPGHADRTRAARPQRPAAAPVAASVGRARLGAPTALRRGAG